jgi:hypothetical protein
VAIEALDEVSHGRPAAQSSQFCGVDKWLALRNCQNGYCPTDMIDSLTASADDPLKCCLLCRRDRS